MVADQVQTGLREKGKGASCVHWAPAFFLISGIAENFLLLASPSFTPPPPTLPCSLRTLNLFSIPSGWGGGGRRGLLEVLTSVRVFKCFSFPAPPPPHPPPLSPPSSSLPSPSRVTEFPNLLFGSHFIVLEKNAT